MISSSLLIVAAYLATLAKAGGLLAPVGSPQPIVAPNPGNSVPNIALQSFRGLAYERLDPIISPGVVGSQHVHRILGGSNFAPTYDPDLQRQAACTTFDVQADKSNYWAPAVYWQHANGTYSPLQGETRAYYETLLPIGDGTMAVPTEPFPYNFQMVAGNPAFKGPTIWTDFSTQANFYYCATSPDGTQGFQSWGFPTQYCYFISAKSFFPSCWNGNAYNVSAPTAHMAYPTDNIGVGGTQTCPPGYPRRLPLLLLENVYYSLSAYSADGYHNGSYILANGDLTGYGLHADFQNGWNMTVLTNFINNPLCQRPPYAAPANVCPDLAPSYSWDGAMACRLTAPNKIVNEFVGLDTPLVALPGCNRPWLYGPKPTCRQGLFGPSMITPQGYGGWDNAPMP